MVIFFHNIGNRLLSTLQKFYCYWCKVLKGILPLISKYVCHNWNNTSDKVCMWVGYKSRFIENNYKPFISELFSPLMILILIFTCVSNRYQYHCVLAVNRCVQMRFPMITDEMILCNCVSNCEVCSWICHRLLYYEIVPSCSICTNLYITNYLSMYIFGFRIYIVYCPYPPILRAYFVYIIDWW